MPYQVISRALETLVTRHGITALASSHLPMIGGAQVGEVAPSQVAVSLENAEVTRDMTTNFLGNQMVRPDAYASTGAVSGSNGSRHGFDQASGSHISATEATQDKGDAVQSNAIFDKCDSFDFRQNLSALEDLLLRGDAELEGLNQTTNFVTDIADYKEKMNSSTLEGDVGRSLPRLELEIGTQILQPDSARHQADYVAIDAINCQRTVVNVDMGKQNKTNRIAKEYGITQEVIKQQYGKKLVDAANSLGVARSTFKRICRDYKIYRWPRVKSRKGSCSLAQADLSQDVDRQPSDYGARQQQYVNISPRSGPKPVTNSKELAFPMLSENVISVKVTYGNRTVRFPLSLSSGKTDLEKEVDKRMKIAGNSSFRYEDEENDLILITCDSDLHYAMHTLRSLGRTIIKMLVEIEPGITMT